MKPHTFQTLLQQFDPVSRTGRVCRIMPDYIEADGPNVPLGSLCLIESKGQIHNRNFMAEVVGVNHDSIILSPFEQNVPTFSGAVVEASRQSLQTGVGRGFLGRALDGLGEPLDGKGPVRHTDTHPLHGEPCQPLDRISRPTAAQTGIRAIDGLLTIGEGQRVGIFAPSGAGKTSLMTQLARQMKADVIILCLVGERGREVEYLWNHALSGETRQRTILVAATSDQPASMRVRAGSHAIAHAEYWRAQGKHVLLLLDSATRLAMALREIGLAAGEPPTVRAYTPGVFSRIPKLVERCGALRSGGAITAIWTVLAESDDVDDPVSEMMKSLLDGHIILSRSLAEQGQFPAIDVTRSISRQAAGLVNEKQRSNARAVLEWLSIYEESKTLVQAGLYTSGSNPVLDAAIDKRHEIIRFLKQEMHESSTFEKTQEALGQLAGKEF